MLGTPEKRPNGQSDGRLFQRTLLGRTDLVNTFQVSGILLGPCNNKKYEKGQKNSSCCVRLTCED